MGLSRWEPLIERLARQTGWHVIDRDGDVYHIRADDCSAAYQVRVRYREEALNVSFQAYLPFRFPLSVVTVELLRGLLIRNTDLVWSKWCLAPLGSCELHPYLYGSLPTAGLEAAAFNSLCRSAVKEIDAVRAELDRELSRLVPGQFNTGLPATRPGSDISRWGK